MSPSVVWYRVQGIGLAAPPDIFPLAVVDSNYGGVYRPRLQTRRVDSNVPRPGARCITSGVVFQTTLWHSLSASPVRAACRQRYEMLVILH